MIATFGWVLNGGTIHKKDLGGGTILGLGIYNIQLAQMVFGGETPTVVASGHMGEDGVDESNSTTLIYKNGRTATLISHSRVELNNEVCTYLFNYKLDHISLEQIKKNMHKIY